jgi:hypothetical protein
MCTEAKIAALAKRLVGLNLEFINYVYKCWLDDGETKKYEKVLEKRLGCPVELRTAPWGFKIDILGEKFVFELCNHRGCYELHKL